MFFDERYRYTVRPGQNEPKEPRWHSSVQRCPNSATVRKRRELLRGAIDIAAEVGDIHNRAMMVLNLGNIYLSRHQPTAALRFYEESVAVFQGYGDCATEAKALANIAEAHRQLGRTDLAEQAMQRRRELLEF
jgi:tetratricopeptide (TPR) repeat protein